MVDLSQNQPLKQKPISDAPASDQSPVTQPVAPSKQLDDISSPQITTEEKIATPEQEEIKKELSELGIPPEGRGKKTKVILAALGVLLLAATLPAAVYLVKQRQEIRRQAYEGQVCQIDADCDGQCEVCRNGRCETKTCGGDQCLGWGTCTCKSECHVSGDGYICCNGDWVPQAQGCADCAPTEETNCTDGIDNDNDGLTDCDDSDCSDDPACQPPGEGLTCSASGGVAKICNRTNQTLNVNYNLAKCSRTERCTSPYGCNVEKKPGSVTIGPNSCKTVGSVQTTCRLWQIDFDASGNGYSCQAADSACEWDESCEEPPESPPPGCYGTCANDDECQGDLVCQNSICVNADCPDESDCTCEAQCEYCKVFDEDWNEITNLSTIEVGQTVYLATFGSTSHAQGITKARFRINGGDWRETTDRHQNMFYIQHVILEAGSYLIESMVYNPGLGWY